MKEIRFDFGFDCVENKQLYNNEIIDIDQLESAEPTCKRSLDALDRSFWVGKNDELFKL